jgi:RND family efflux transporter MFP subunit
LQELDIAKLRKDLGSGSVLTAPFAGVVTALNYSPGARTNPSLPVVTIAALNGGFVFTATIDLENAEHLSVGDPATVSLGGLDGQKIQGQITEIRDTQGQVGVKKDLLVDLPGDGLSGGESGELTIEKNIGYYKLLVPNSAVGDGDNGKFVYVLREKRGPLGNEYSVQLVDVAVGESDNLNTAILNGLQDGDRVITGSDKQINDGSRVMVNQ